MVDYAPPAWDAVDLDFGDETYAGAAWDAVTLDFEHDAPPPGPLAATLYAALGGPAGGWAGRLGQPATLYAALGGPVGALFGRYDDQLADPIGVRGTDRARAAEPRHASTASAWRTAPTAASVHCEQAGPAARLDAAGGGSWRVVETVSRAVEARSTSAASLASASAALARVRRTGSAVGSDRARSADALASATLAMFRVRGTGVVVAREVGRAALPLWVVCGSGWRIAGWLLAPAGAGFRQAAYPGLGVRRSDTGPAVPVELPCYTPSAWDGVLLDFGGIGYAPPAWDRVALAFTCPRQRSWFSVPARRVYVVENSVLLTRAVDGARLDCSTLTLALDADSSSWRCSATVHGRDARTLIAPASSSALLLEARINGSDWRWVLESADGSERVADEQYSLTGRSRSALLGSPWSRPRDRVEPAALAAQQLAAAELPLAGWALLWEGADWPVPADVWSYRGLSPLAAIGRIAEAAGAIVVPSRTDQALVVRPRYPAAPWALEAAVASGEVLPSLDVPRSAIASTSPVLQFPGSADAIYLHSAEAGVLGHVVRTGSAGAEVADTVLDALLTHPDALRQRGIRELARTAAQASLRQITLPFGPEFPMPAPGDVIRYGLAGGGTELAVVSAVEVRVTRSGNALDVWQTITLGEWTGNDWVRLRDLLPGDPLLVGTVTDITYGRRVVALLGGGEILARGVGEVGTRVWVRGGVIEGAAPAADTEYEIAV